MLVGKGGVFLAVRPRLQTSITKRGQAPSGRVVWVNLDHLTLGKLSILAIYAPNGRQHRAELWHELVDKLDCK